MHPRGNNCYQVCTNDTSWARRAYTYDSDGRVIDLLDTPWPIAYGNGGARHLQLNPDDGFGAVYRSVIVNGAAYQYWYDAQGRRRLKQYPNGLVDDEYFYDGDHLIEDRGNTTKWPSPNMPQRYVMDEYVWLGGMPVAVLKSTFDSNFVRTTADVNEAYCARNDEPESCGIYYLINDGLPKPVAMLDRSGRVAGVGEYDPFGRVNRVVLMDETQPALGAYAPNQNTILSYIKQAPRTAREQVKLRVNYAQVNTNSSADRTWLEDGQGQPLIDGYHGWLLGAVDSPWVPVGSDGLVHVRFTSDSMPEYLPNYTGVTVGSYEYRRYETGASPWWTALRFPGQYADAESGLFENWNRFYDPATGGYTASDPILQSAALVGPTAYGYGANNPLNLADQTGLLANEARINSHFLASAADLQRECSEGNEVSCEDWGLMPQDPGGGKKAYPTKAAAGKAAATMLRRLAYSRFGGHRKPTTSFEYGGKLIGRGNRWFYTEPQTQFDRNRFTFTGTTEQDVYHSHAEDKVIMWLEGKTYPEGTSGEDFSDLDTTFRTNVMLSPTNKVYIWDRSTGTSPELK